MKKRIFAAVLAMVLLLVLLPTPAKAVASALKTVGDWTIGIDDNFPNQRLILRYTGKASYVTIPTQLGGWEIDGVHDLAFRENTTMKVLNVPDGMWVHGLFGCDVETVNLGKDVILLSGAFSGCKYLKKVNIPDNAERIPGALFENCASLASITIPAGVTSIGGSAFEGCTSLTSLTIPAAVTKIAIEAFAGCTNLKTINIPKNVTEIQYDAFAGCGSLESIQVEAGNTVYFNDSDGNLRYVNQQGKAVLFRAVSGNGETYTVPEDVEVIDRNAFSGAKGLKKVVIPATVTEIDLEAFRDCADLTEIYFEGRPRIYQDAFENVTAKAFYPGDTDQWQESDMEGLYGDLTWIPYCTGIHKGPLGTVVKDATCTDTGTAENTCELCGETYIYEIPMKEHAYDDGVVTKEAICMTNGVLTYTCVDCGDFYTERIPCPGHAFDWENGEIIQEAGCISKGKAVYYCKDCDAISESEIEALGHDYTDAEVVFYPEKLKHGKVCNLCGVPKTEECSFGEGAVTTEATPTQLGVMQYECDVCGGTSAESFICRIYGDNRYETGFDVADALKAQLGVEKFENIVVASGQGFADALAGSYLAAVKHAPILLVNQHFMDEVTAYIEENLVSGGTVYLLGGEAAIPAAMETGLENYTVKRLAGDNRYETNLQILAEAGAGEQEILICTGRSFADSLSASAVGRPILLVNKTLSASQKEFLAASSGKFVIIGGESAVSAQLAAEIQEYGEAERLGGANRYETSVLVAERFFEEPASAVLAYARKFPDGLCGGPLAYSLNAPLLLTATGRGPEVTKYANDADITVGAVLGGPGLIDDTTVNNVFGLK